MKKAYRILEELCSRSTTNIEQFLNGYRSNLLLEHLLMSLMKSSSALKGVRSFVCFLCLSNNQTVEKIKQIIPQVDELHAAINVETKDFIRFCNKAVQCLHEINSRTRHDAYLLIIKCARLWTTMSEQSFIGNYIY
jgi:DNA-binding transcriptional regulator WhiA